MAAASPPPVQAPPAGAGVGEIMAEKSAVWRMAGVAGDGLEQRGRQPEGGEGGGIGVRHAGSVLRVASIQG